MKKMNNKGFTIVELVIVIAVIAILAAVLIPTFSGVVEKANESAAVQTVRGALSNVLASNTDQGKLNGGEFVINSGNDNYQFTYYNGQLIATESTINNQTYKAGKDALGHDLKLEKVNDKAAHLTLSGGYTQIVVKSFDATNGIGANALNAVIAALNANITDTNKQLKAASFTYDGENKKMTVTYESLTYVFTVYVNSDLSDATVAFVK